MDFRAHAVAQRLVDALVLLHPADAGELRADDHGLEVLAVVAQHLRVLAGQAIHDVDSLNYQATFSPADSTWQTLRLPLASFGASFRGREVPDAPPLDPARIRQVGLLIAARQVGPFALQIRRIGLA